MRRLSSRAAGVLRGDKRAFDRIARPFYADLWRGASEALGATCEDLGREVLRIQRGDAGVFVRRSQLPLDSRLIGEVAGDKALCFRLLEAEGVPVPRWHAFELEGTGDAWDEARGFGGPVVVKPARRGSAGRGVTTDVDSERAFRRAVWAAVPHGDGLLAEEQVEGASLRLLFLDGEFVDAIRRDPPSLVGDGRSSIAALLAAENDRRRNDPPTALHPLTDDGALRTHLGAQGLGPGSVPGKGAVVRVKRACNQNAARDNVRITESVHPEVVALARRAAAALGVRFAGVDLLAEDPVRAPADARVVVGEVNTNPALHHHVFCTDASGETDGGERVVKTVLEQLLEDAR